MLNCDECLARLEALPLRETLVLLDQSTHPEGRDLDLPHADLMQHLSDCPDCRAQWRELCEAWSALPMDLPVAPIDAALADAILTRAMAPQREAAGLPASGATRSNRWVKYAVAATVLIGLTGAYAAIRFQDNSVQSPPLAQVEHQLHDLARQLNRLDAMKQAFSQPKLRYVSFRPRSSAGVGAYMVYDPVSNEGHFLAFGLPALQQGTEQGTAQAYILWLLDAQQHAVAHVEVVRDAEGRAAVTIPFPVPANAVVTTRVTTEQRPFPSEPSGPGLLNASIAPTRD